MSVLETKNFKKNFSSHNEKNGSSFEIKKTEEFSSKIALEEALHTINEQSQILKEFSTSTNSTKNKEIILNPENTDTTLKQNSIGFNKILTEIQLTNASAKPLPNAIKSDNSTLLMCLIAANSTELQVNISKLTENKDTIVKIEKDLESLAHAILKKNTIRPSTLSVKFFNSASMTENQLHATVFGQPISKDELKAFYDSENDNIWINLDKSTGSIHDIMASFANELSHHIDDIKNRDFTPQRQTQSSITECHCRNLITQLLGPDLTNKDQIRTFRQQAFILNLDERNTLSGKVKNVQPAIISSSVIIGLGMLGGGLFDYSLQVGENYFIDKKPLKESLSEINKSSVAFSTGIGAVPGASYYKIFNKGTKTTQKLIRIGHVETAANNIRKYLGNNAKMITNKSGDKVFINYNNTKRVRFDINNPSPHKNPHAHVEKLVNKKWKKSGQIYPKDVLPE